ncbi:MAG: type II secretion system protein [Legionellales bacterium]|nr:type II secretion system protein [Legionellales bacterium]
MLGKYPVSAKKTGFTLIEMMFVILVLSFVVVQIARTQQAKVQQQTIEHAANDMLNWELAIVSYYQANGAWPTTTTMPTALTVLAPQNPSSSSPDYMPNSALASPFLLNNNTHAPYQGALPQNSTGGSNYDYYVLSVEIDSYNMAKLLAAKLPNAYISTKPTISVYMAIPVPSQTVQSRNRGWIVSAGVVSTTSGFGNFPADSDAQSSNSNYNRGSPGASVYLPNCPTGTEGHIILSPLEYETNDYNWGMHINIVNTLANGLGVSQASATLGQPCSPPSAQYQSDCIGNGTSGETSANPFINYDSSNPSHPYVIIGDNPDYKTKTNSSGVSIDDTSTSVRHLATFMTFCLPLTYNAQGQLNQYPSKWYTSNLQQGLAQDGECSSSWNTYLNDVSGNANPNCNTSQQSLVGNADAY